MPYPDTSIGSPPRLPAMRSRRWLVAALGAILFVFAGAASAQVSPLPPEKAFRFSARALDPHTVEARFSIADGYYLYRDKLRFTVEPAASGLAVPSFPSGRIKEDPFFGRVETYRGNVIVNLQLPGTAPGQKVIVQAESQGCADLGICYPPNIQRVTVPLPAAGSAPTRPDEIPRKQWFQ
jgi:thioredoxin:protein disulfide reductase